ARSLIRTYTHRTSPLRCRSLFWLRRDLERRSRINGSTVRDWQNGDDGGAVGVALEGEDDHARPVFLSLFLHPRKSGSHQTPRWRERDSNPWSPLHGTIGPATCLRILRREQHPHHLPAVPVMLDHFTRHATLTANKAAVARQE